MYDSVSITNFGGDAEDADTLKQYVYVFMYVCMYVCIYECCMYLFMYVYMYICMYVCMYACMYVCMYVWVYVYMSVCTSALSTFQLALIFWFYQVVQQQQHPEPWKMVP